MVAILKYHMAASVKISDSTIMFTEIENIGIDTCILVPGGIELDIWAKIWYSLGPYFISIWRPPGGAN